VRDWNGAAASDTARCGRFHAQLTAAGVYWPPSQFEAAFLSLAHTDEDIDHTLKVARDALERSRA
jgi:glutamate-1-semialdehyde 2,1-aminomutase